MQWRVILAAVLLVLLLFGGILSLHQTESICNQVSQPLRRLSAQLQTQKKGENALLSQAMDVWEKALPYLSSVISHDRLDEISGALLRAEGFLAAGDGGETLAELQDALWKLELLQKYDRPTVRSLL